jgi:hypothetical protein
MWAILSGIAGNLAAYEAVLAELRRLPVSKLYILGNLIGPGPDNQKLVQRVQHPQPGEPIPQVCRGWWEEQLLVLHGLGPVSQPTALIERYGAEMVKTFRDAAPQPVVEWARSLNLGFVEQGCLLVYGSSISVEDALTPDTSPLVIRDRLSRVAAVNTLFCGRSGLAFEYAIEGGATTTTLTTLNEEKPTVIVEASRQLLVGVGSLGCTPGQATYTIYSPANQQVEFKMVLY